MKRLALIAFGLLTAKAVKLNEYNVSVMVEISKNLKEDENEIKDTTTATNAT